MDIKWLQRDQRALGLIAMFKKALWTVQLIALMLRKRKEKHQLFLELFLFFYIYKFLIIDNNDNFDNFDIFYYYYV